MSSLSIDTSMIRRNKPSGFGVKLDASGTSVRNVFVAESVENSGPSQIDLGVDVLKPVGVSR